MIMSSKKLSVEKTDYLEKTYFDISKAGALTGPAKHYQIVKKDGKFKISRKKSNSG